MSTKHEATGFLTTGDGLVDGFLRGLNQSGRSDTENFRALAKAVLWVSMHDPDGESEGMAQARELMRNGALMFERAVKQAKASAQIESGVESELEPEGV